MNSKGEDESREGVPLTNLDQALLDGSDATKRDLVEYLDAVRDRIIPVLEDRPLSCEVMTHMFSGGAIVTNILSP